MTEQPVIASVAKQSLAVIPMKIGISVLNTIQDHLFPIFCVDCGVEGEIWCTNCRRQLNVSGIFICPSCDLPSDGGKTHATCVGANFYLDGFLAIVPYRDNSPLTRLLKQLKYHFVVDKVNWINEILRQWLAFNHERTLEIFSGRTIMPVPLHGRRLRERGFNQAELIAKSLQAVLGERGLDVKFDCELKRSRYTDAQAQLSHSDRRKNMNEAFAWPAGIICPEEVILVDDVYTTGATMNAAASALKAAGARSVWGFSLLRG